jgi:hypothetical protein
MTSRLTYVSLSFALVCGCQPAPSVGSDNGPGGKKEDSSAEATILNFEFDGSLESSGFAFGGPDAMIRGQMLYTIGHLNGDRAVGRLDRLTLTNIKTSSIAGGMTRITYHAAMPVAWASKSNFPKTYTFTLPQTDDYDTFTTKYKDGCTESSPHAIDASSMWYYYRPQNSGCNFAAADVFNSTASVAVSSVNTTGKYPEYNKVWEDNTLRVVSIFGKYEKTDTDNSDAGIQAYNTFVSAIRSQLAGPNLTTIPANVPAVPGNDNPDITFSTTLPDGRKVVVNALLVDEISSAPETFYQRYEQLTANADMIAYNGHAGLGQNVRALAHRGKWVAGQYLLFFSNGCDTYAYVDGYMAQTRAAINLDDPTGTKYMDIVVNAMPAFFASDSSASMALIRALLNVASPLTYENIFRNIDNSQVVLVTGEEDNVFQP